MASGAVAGQAVASLLRLAESDLRDADLLGSGRNPGNAPGLLRLAAERLVQAVLAAESGWPLPVREPGLALVPDANPLKLRLLALAAPLSLKQPSVADDGAAPEPPDKALFRAALREARAVLALLSETFGVDLRGQGAAATAAPVRPPPPAAPRAARQAARATAKADPPASQAESGQAGIRAPAKPAAPFRVGPAMPPEPHPVAGRAAIEVSRGSASVASTAFWLLMDRWGVPDTAALDLLGHGGGLTKKGTRSRFKLAGAEAETLKGLQEIDAALSLLPFDPKTWLQQPIAAAPFGGEAPVAYLARTRMAGVHETLRFILQSGLVLSMSAGKRDG